MHVRIVLLVSVILTLDLVLGAFFYNPTLPTNQQYEERGLKCVPGRTVIQIEAIKAESAKYSSDEETRRTHMNAVATQDETCKICICSIEGKDEYCSRRPARNVNECLRLAILKKTLEKNGPFSHDRSLSFRIRRDYIWHYDEIPYAAKAACKRSTSYYSNNINANDTDIDVPTDVDSLLDYSNKEICFYCVCSVDGTHAGCIARDPWYCEYYRIIRHPKAAKERYKSLFQQDRPQYFRHLSYRLRRTMDDGMAAFMDVVGDGNNNKCIPYVSEYSDCSEANACSGCTRCTCNAEGEWDCQMVFECPTDDDDVDASHTVTAALDILYSELKNKEKNQHRVLVPPPPKPEDELLVSGRNPYEENFASYFTRQKRAIKNKDEDENKNHTVKFFYTVDELNEDTLQHSGNSGTIKAKRVESSRSPKISRRTDLTDNNNNKNKSSLHINYNQEEYDHHIKENKIVPTEHSDKIIENKLNHLVGNYSQEAKDSELSKLIVNELKGGTEVIGNTNISPVSNITFTPENDTLTAMAFIAGNLLNKLWDMERVASNDFIQIDALKHEKINDLLELFKEPLNIRQETFLKNALEKLSNTLNKYKDVKNVSVCETITTDLTSGENSNNNNHQAEVTKKKLCDKKESVKKEEENKNNVSIDVIDKLNDVISLMKKFEQVEKSLNELNHLVITEPPNVGKPLTFDENSSMHLFGNLLEKITKLLIPNKSSKKIINRIKNLNQFTSKENNKKNIEEKFATDLNNYNLTIKDKLILDYLNHIESNPNCLLRKNIQSKLNNKTGGRILYNLSELLKIKSLTDLVKLSKSDDRVETTTIMATEVPIQEVTNKTILRDNNSVKLNNTKEKLKSHLKEIIDDLLELQNDTDLKQNKINIADALPCIYNIMNSESKTNNKMLAQLNMSPLNKIKILIDSMKLEFTTMLPTRRSNFQGDERPHSAKMWERVIKNINELRKKTRRTLDYESPKSYNELAEMIENVEATGNTYKNFALLSVVPPHKTLMLLKTLEADTKQQAIVLENIKKSANSLINLPADKVKEIKEFIDNTENNINLSIKVMQNLAKQTNSKYKSSDLNRNEQLRMPELKKVSGVVDDGVKLTRGQIIIQLMENRIKLYLHSKEDIDVDLNHDVNYNIGKRILSLIKSGNLSVAKELFKIFIANQREEGAGKHGAIKPSLPFQNVMESRVFKSANSDIPPDQLFKRLLDVKNMNL